MYQTHPGVNNAPLSLSDHYTTRFDPEKHLLSSPRVKWKNTRQQLQRAAIFVSPGVRGDTHLYVEVQPDETIELPEVWSVVVAQKMPGLERV